MTEPKEYFESIILSIRNVVYDDKISWADTQLVLSRIKKNISYILAVIDEKVEKGENEQWVKGKKIK